MAIGCSFISAIGGYYIGGYLWLFYYWLFYWWLLVDVLLMTTSGYFINNFHQGEISKVQ